MNGNEEQDSGSSKARTQAAKLYRLACQFRERSYSPYSRHKVGAALRLSDGRVFGGCNIENSSYGGTVCAERTAILKAVSESDAPVSIAEIVGRHGLDPGPGRLAEALPPGSSREFASPDIHESSSRPILQEQGAGLRSLSVTCFRTHSRLSISRNEIASK